MRNVEAVRKSLVRQGAKVHWSHPHGVCFSPGESGARFTLGSSVGLRVTLRDEMDSSDLRADIDAATDMALVALADAAEAGPLPDPPRPAPAAPERAAAVRDAADDDDPFSGISD